MSYGFEVTDKDGEVTFQLTTRLTTVLRSFVVSANSSGSTTIDVPSNMDVSVQAIPMYADSNMRHVGHRVSYDAWTKTVSWSPGYNGPDYSRFTAWARPVKTGSRIMVFGFMSE